MRLHRLTLAAYGRCKDVDIDIGENVTVVLGVNEAGKSTALDALGDLLWGIPRISPRASEFTRPQLRIDAVIEADDTRRTVVRRSTGLFTEDGATEISPPWDPEQRLTADWWRTRLGIAHADLRDSGNAVFTGDGDIAEVVFAAREGHSAREILNKIADEADKLFKQHRGNKNVQLRLAAKGYQQAITDRDARLTRAGAVMEQRETVDRLDAERRLAQDAVARTSQTLKREEENQRVIAVVLKLRQARSEREAVDREGDRLSPSELEDYQTASTEHQEAGKRISKLDNDIARIVEDVNALSVDDRLLGDKATISRLQSDAKARVEDLHRADDEFGPAATGKTMLLWELLGRIGIGVSDEIDTALDGVRVRTDHAATLNELADRIEDLDEKRQDVRAARDRALEELAAKGVTVDVEESTAPSEEAISEVRRDLGLARTQEATAEGLLSKATEAVDAMRAKAPTRGAEHTVGHDDVLGARGNRDSQWAAIRRSWVAGDLPAATDRVDMATELDKRLDGADKVADDAAAQRARDARNDAHVEGLEEARAAERSARVKLEEAAKHRRELELKWAAIWSDVGVTRVPSVDSGSAVAGLLTVAHREHGRDRLLAGELEGISESWRAAAELVGLSAACTTSAWRKRVEVLEEIESVRVQRAEIRVREAQARRKWDDFVAEALELLGRHGVLDESQPVTAAIVEQGLDRLAGQLDAATEAAGQRAAHREQIDKLRTSRDEAEQDRDDALGSLRGLAKIHSVDVGPDLDVLAERARNAMGPLECEANSTEAIRNGLSPGSNVPDVIERLEDSDEVTVERAVEEAQVRDQEARRAADGILGDYTSASDRLNELERAAGAADAEAEVASRQAEVAELTEKWAILTLQRKLLEDVLDGLGSDDTRPLLDHAGRILEQLTDGRWLALRAEDDGASRKLLVIRADNIPCGTTQLSEGTADQVFLSLRLAAVAELHNARIESGEQAIPLVLDDVLMAFDEARTKHAIKILESLAPGLQVIVFTHHEHVARAASALDQVKVCRLPAAAPIPDTLDAGLIRAQAQRNTLVTAADSSFSRA